MAIRKKRRKVWIFSIIALVLLGLAAVAVFRKRDIYTTVQTEKVARRSLTEVVPANGKIQPVLQVKISAEVSGEIIDLPVKEGQLVKKGDLLVKIKPDFYVAAMKQADAGYQSSLAGKTTAAANLKKMEAEFKRSKDLFRQKLISDSTFDETQAAYDVAQAQLESATHQVEMARASVDSAKDSLDKTTIVAPLTGTISKLNSRLGERVLGTVQNVGTDIMTIADLNEMETRVDVGENDVVRIAPGQKVRLEVDAFKDRKFTGLVTEIANSAKDAGMGGGSSQEATKFEVRIRIQEKEAFRPGMSVTAEIETAYQTNVLTVPFAAVTSRPPKEKKDASKAGAKGTNTVATGTNAVAKTNAAAGTNAPLAGADAKLAATASTNSVSNSTAKAGATNSLASGMNAPDRKSKELAKPINVVFVVEGDHVKMVPVKLGISDDNYWEITEGLSEGQEIVSGNSRAVNRDLEDDRKIRKGGAGMDNPKDAARK
jgi:HlyD family secretion protein